MYMRCVVPVQNRMLYAPVSSTSGAKAQSDIWRFNRRVCSFTMQRENQHQQRGSIDDTVWGRWVCNDDTKCAKYSYSHKLNLRASILVSR